MSIKSTGITTNTIGITTALVWLVGVAGAGALSPAGAAAPSTPNVILIVSDDYGWPHYGFMQRYLKRKLCTDESETCTPELGEAYRDSQILLPDDTDSATPPLDRLLTPALDALAEDGVYFPVAHTSASRCKPSYASMLTGLYVRDLDRTLSNGKQVSQTTSPIIPELLPPEYLTLGAGKLWSGIFVEEQVEGKRQKARRKRAFDSERPVSNSNRTIARGAQQTIKEFIDCATCANDGAACGAFTGRGDSDRLRNRVKDCDAAPFFVFYAPGMPHPSFVSLPFCPDYPRDGGQCATEPYKTHSAYCRGDLFPEGLSCPLFGNAGPQRILANLENEDGSAAARLSRLSRYLDFVNVFDRTVDEIVVFLKARGLGDNTIILYVTDNGARLEGSKSRFRENGYRTPIIVSYAGLPAENCTSSGDLPGCRKEFAHATDLAATILNLTGCVSDDCGGSDFEGRDLTDPQGLDRSCGPSAGPGFIQCVFGQQGGQQNLGDDFPGRYVLAEIEETVGGRTRLCKYYKDCLGGGAKLHDLTEDPSERCDLIGNAGRCAVGEPLCALHQKTLDEILTDWEPICGEH